MFLHLAVPPVFSNLSVALSPKSFHRFNSLKIASLKPLGIAVCFISDVIQTEAQSVCLELFSAVDKYTSVQYLQLQDSASK